LACSTPHKAASCPAHPSASTCGAFAVCVLAPNCSAGLPPRHILDHYRLLLDSLDHADNHVNYDTRERDTPLETSRDVAIDSLRALIRRFEREQSRCSIDKPLQLLALTPEAQELSTTFGREVRSCSRPAEPVLTLSRSYGSHLCTPVGHVFATVSRQADVVHTVHHYSLIRVSFDRTSRIYCI
jgi:hypothetical protein